MILQYRTTDFVTVSAATDGSAHEEDPGHVIGDLILGDTGRVFRVVDTLIEKAGDVVMKTFVLELLGEAYDINGVV